MSILQALYDSEINWQIATFWHGGFDWKLGDAMNGFKAEGYGKTLEDAAEQLAKAAKEHFPGSLFALGQQLFEKQAKNG